MAYRLAAAVAFIGILACSGLGICWRQFASAAHHCCTGDDGSTATQVRPCASVVAHEAAVKIVPPAVAQLPATLDPESLTTMAAPGAGPLAPTKSPPPILRI
jgi:hypothetical protein